MTHIPGNVAYVVCVNQTGTIGLTQFHGGSRIIDPLGNTLVEMGNTAGLSALTLISTGYRSCGHPTTLPLIRC
jgi:predicted amidohydrolase